MERRAFPLPECHCPKDYRRALVRSKVLRVMSKTLFRCAIYTRKSTEEGLDQAFNSLDAQREACAAYIRSQSGLGWKLISKRYDDGGVSGGTIDRPSLRALLEDIKQKSIDTVVVYKIDRLTRSLMDFSKIVDVFDSHEVSFVSVTQQFNTTTSMGRLTLNVLLSFAQFEREVTSERIRDKIAASRKKGMWMGGPVPIGYRTEDKRLVIERSEADVVQRVFRLYLEIGSVPRLKERIDASGWVTPKRERRDGQSGGKPFSIGHLYWILSNRLYAGDVHHRGQTWPGQHEPIVTRELWDEVQQKLADNEVKAERKSRATLLTGILFDETGDRLSPSHATKAGRRYRYYVSRRLVQARRKDETGWRLPAEQLEKTVLAFLTNLLGDAVQLAKLIGRRDPAVIRQAFSRAAELVASGLDTLARRRELIRSIFTKIIVDPETLSLAISHAGLCGALNIPPLNTAEAADTVINLPCTLRHRGIESRLVIAGKDQSTAVDTKLVKIIAKAHEWMDRLVGGRESSVTSIARHEQLEDGEISRVLPLAFLAPDIVEGILSGRQPVALTARSLKRLKPLPLSWPDQRRLLGFPSSS